MSRTFHVLTESEPFTKSYGGVLARWVANVLQADNDALVLAPSADDSWQFSRERVRTVKGLSAYKSFYEGGGYVLPWVVNTTLLRRVFEDVLYDLQAGETLWIHNRPEFALALAPFIRSRGARLFLHLHNSQLVQWSERVTRAFKADCYVFSSRFLEREALAKFPDLGNTEVLPSGPDPRAFYPPTEARGNALLRTIVFSARMAPENDVLLFLEAMATLCKQHVPVRGVVVGGANFGDREPTTYLQELRERAPANVSFEAFLSSEALGRLLRHADVFCMPPCWHEPISLHVLEALACALPVVAVESGGLPEILAQTGGILVAPRSATHLAEALQLVATDAATRTHMAQAAYKAYTHNFMWATVRHGYARILASTPARTSPLRLASAPLTA
jgi:glycosyltransferase involved in cell wall biosynthesis